MERIVNDSICSYLSNSSLISPCQHGFRRGRSTTSNLLESVTDWSLNLDHQRSTDAIYFDFRKAFDSVSHTKLLLKLRAYGLSGPLLNWLLSFLSNRSQFVSIGGAASELSAVTSGVPQGTVLGPTWFLIFINDICDTSEGLDILYKLFADDLKIYALCDGHCHSPTLASALLRIEDWCTTWQLPLALDKCITIHFGKRSNQAVTPSSLNYYLFLSPIASSRCVKDLGVLIDDQLKFDAQVASVVNKALTRSRLIFRCFSSRNKSLLLKAYITYVRPLLEYCNVVWSPRVGYLSDKVERVQRFFTKRIPGCWYLPYSSRLSLLGLQTLESRRSISDHVICYKIVHGIYDSPITRLFHRKPSLRTRGHDLRLQELAFNKDIAKYSFPHRTIRLWNSLPDDTVHAPSTASFIHRVSNLPFTNL